MATYYVIVPNTEFPTAEVGAPDSRHARTAYLDYLSRSDIIQYSQRQTVRKKIITERMDPGEYQAQIKLEYGVTEPPEEDISIPSPGEEPIEGSYGPYSPQYREREPESPDMSDAHFDGDRPAAEGYAEELAPSPKPFSRSPIEELSKRSGGL